MQHIKRSPLIHLLSIAFLVQVTAQAVEVLLNSSPLNSLLFLNLGFSDFWAKILDQTLALYCIVSASLFIATFKRDFLMGPLVWLFALPISTTLLHSSFAYQLSIPANFCRATIGLGLYWLVKGKIKNAHGLFRVGLALTFIGHGMEAISEHPLFMDYILDFSDKYLAREWPVDQVLTYLKVIGVIDVAIGLLALYMSHPLGFIWMTFWGLITAIERINYHGAAGITECFLRTPHWIIPLYFVLKYISGRKPQLDEAKEISA